MDICEARLTYSESLRLFHISLNDDQLIPRKFLELGGRFRVSNDRNDEGLFLGILFHPFNLWGERIQGEIAACEWDVMACELTPSPRAAPVITMTRSVEEAGIITGEKESSLKGC